MDSPGYQQCPRRVKPGRITFMVDLFFLKTFVDIVKSGSFRVAAERNFITQPAVSQHVKLIERKLETRLLHRQGKKVSLTAEGEVFFKYAENILGLYTEAKQRVKELKPGQNETIRIFSIYSIGLYRIQQAVRRVLLKCPAMHFQVEYGHNSLVYEKVFNKSADFGFVSYPKKKPGLMMHVFAQEKLVLVQSKERPIFKQKNISLADLNEKNFLTFSAKSPTGSQVSDFLKSKSVHPRIAHEYDNIETLKNSLEVGSGCAILPESVVQKELQKNILEIVGVKELRLKRPLGIIYQKGRTFSKASQNFYKLFVPR